MQNWTDLYKELCELVAENIPAVKWIDLWHNQVGFLEDEHPFPTPAVFFSFRVLTTDDLGNKAQQVNLQVTAYLYFETMADTYHGAWNQSSALEFLDTLTALHGVLHASSGTNYSEMRRTGLASVDTGSAGNLYMQSFICRLVDYAAQRTLVDMNINDMTVTNAPGPEREVENNYDINT